MAKFRGLRTRLCGSCGKIAAHKTLYVKTESGGKTKWHRIFWICTSCNALDHVVLPTYKLESVPSDLPGILATSVVDALRGRPLDIDELILSMRSRLRGVRHVFNSEVGMVLLYLRHSGVVTEKMVDLTEGTLVELRARSEKSNHLGVCPAEESQGAVMKGLVSLYAQHRLEGRASSSGNHVGPLSLTPVGVLCIRCGYHRVDPTLITGHP